MKKKMFIVSISLLISLLFIEQSYAGNAVQQQDSLAHYYLKLKNLQEENASLITPELFGETIVLFKNANQAKSSGQNSIYKDQLSQIKKNIVEMSVIVNRSKKIFKPLFKVRKRALQCDAKKYAKVSWLRGENSLKMAIGELGDDNSEDLLKYVKEAIENYRFCEFQALKKKYLSSAIEALSSAKKVDADKWSGISFKTAVQYIKKTEKVIKDSPDDHDKILEFALQAVEQAKAAEKYAVIIKKATSQPQCFEKILIENRIQLMKYSEMLGIKNNSLWQAEELDTLLSLEIYKLINERKMLVSEMNSYETELKKIKIKVDSCYDSRKKESDFRKKISGIKSLFEDEDAEILLSAENLVLRIFGVKFFSDNSYIPPEYFGVLNKLSQAIDDLGEQLITINVHTDSRGSAKRNRVISAKQAETVKIFLLANMTSKRLDIIAVGKGESMPIASNAGEKGRRLNRRIEVVIPLKISN